MAKLFRVIQLHTSVQDNRHTSCLILLQCKLKTFLFLYVAAAKYFLLLLIYTISMYLISFLK